MATYKSISIYVVVFIVLFNLKNLDSASMNKVTMRDTTNNVRVRRELDQSHLIAAPWTDQPHLGLKSSRPNAFYRLAVDSMCRVLASTMLDYAHTQLKQWQHPTWYSLLGNSPDEPGPPKKRRIETDLSSMSLANTPSSSTSSSTIFADWIAFNKAFKQRNPNDNDLVAKTVLDLYGPRINPDEEKNRTKYVNPVCRDNNNKFVDWFIIYKIPQNVEIYVGGGWDPHKSNGTMFAYITSESVKHENNFILSIASIDSPNNMISYTLDPLYNTDDQNDIFFAMYNDDPPGNHSRSQAWKAHSKGVVALGNLTGFWMPHSWPKFPSTTSRNYYEHASLKFGQTFMCISIMTEIAGGQVLDILKTVKPHIYHSSGQVSNNFMDPIAAGRTDWTAQEIFDFFGQDIPTFFNHINNRSTPCDFFSATLMSIYRVPFNIVANSRGYGANIFDHLLYDYNENFMSQTWRRDKTLANEVSLIPQSDNSSNKMVVNICETALYVNKLEDNILYGGAGAFSIFKWEYSKDHAKWAVALDKNIICAGDLNRDEPQNNRGGSLVCFEQEKVSKSLRSSVMSIARLDYCKQGKCPSPWSGIVYGADLRVDAGLPFSNWCDKVDAAVHGELF